MSKLSGIFSLRNFVKKQLMETNKSGIIKFPDKGKVDFGEMMIREELFLRGIDPTLIKDEKVLEGILNTPIVKPKVAPKKPGEVIEVDFDKGRWKDTEPEKFFYGGFVEQPELGQTAHGSEALASRTRLAAPGSTSTTSTGLNYLLAEDNDNQRVPFGDGLRPIDKGFFITPPDPYEGLSSEEKEMRKALDKIMSEKFQKKLSPEDVEKIKIQQEIRKRQAEEMGLPEGLQLMNQGGRTGFAKGKGVDLLRRGFLKTMGAAGAGIAALKTGLLGLGKGTTKQVAKDLTQVPINNIEGMPSWFKPLVNRVIKEGDDVTKKFATKEREIVHTKKIDDVDEVTVYQDLDTGNVTVEYGYHLTDDTGKVIRASNDPEVIHLSYKASEEIPLKGGKGSTKTKEEFSAVESEPEITNFDGDIEMSGVNEVNKVDDLITDTSKLQKYATGEKLTIKELSESMKKQKYKNKLETDNTEAINYIEKKHGPFPDPSDTAGGKDATIKVFEDYYGKASGGRVPLAGGKKAVTKEQLEEMLNVKKPKHWKESPLAIPDDWLKRVKEKYYKKASGGRVPLNKGKIVKGIMSLGKKKKTKTLDVEEHGSAMAEWARKNDPEGYAKIQKFVDDLNQKIELKRAKRQKGRKDHALGGLANMLGE